MKYIVIFFAILSVVLLFTGLYFYLQDNPIYNQFFGYGTLSLFFITFPLFLIWRRNKFDMTKYTWNNDSRHKNPQKKEKTEE